MKRTYCTPGRQIGSAMIVALIFLLLMTLIGTAAMRSSTMQERMAGNARDWNLAFQAAEAALRDAEQFLLTSAVLPPFDDADGFYQLNSPDRPVWTGERPTNGNGFVTYPYDLPGVPARPRYFVEELQTVRPAGSETETGTPLQETFYFRITAVGYGGALDAEENPIAAVVLSSVYRSR